MIGEGVTWTALSSDVIAVVEFFRWPAALLLAMLLLPFISDLLIGAMKIMTAKSEGSTPPPEGGGVAGASSLRGSVAGFKRLRTEARVGWGQLTHSDENRRRAADNLPTEPVGAAFSDKEQVQMWG